MNGIVLTVQSDFFQISVYHQLNSLSAASCVKSADKQCVACISFETVMRSYGKLGHNCVNTSLMEIQHALFISLTGYNKGLFIKVEVADIQIDKLRKTQSAIEKQR